MGTMLQGKGSVDSRCAVGAAVAPELASTFAAIKSPADIPEAEPPAETMDASWWDRRWPEKL
jgi:hypothetical protein